MKKKLLTGAVFLAVAIALISCGNDRCRRCSASVAKAATELVQ